MYKVLVLFFLIFVSFYSLSGSNNFFEKKMINQFNNNEFDDVYNTYMFCKRINDKDKLNKIDLIAFFKIIDNKDLNKQSFYYPKLYHMMGKVSYDLGYPDLTHYYYFKALLFINNTQSDNKFQSLFYEDMGFISYFYRNLTKSKNFLLLAEKRGLYAKSSQINVFNTLGLIYFENYEYDSSFYYYSKALSIANKYKDTIWIGIISGNIGHYYYDKKDFEKSKKLLQIDYKYSFKSKEYISAINSLRMLMKIAIKQSDHKVAKKIILEIKSYSKFNLGEQFDALYSLSFSEYSASINDYKNAYINFRGYFVYLDSIKKKLDVDQTILNENKLEHERDEFKIQLNNSNIKTKNLQIVLIFSISFLVILFLIYFLYTLKSKRKKELENFKLKELQKIQELKFHKKEMNGLINNLIDKNKMLEDLSIQIEFYKNNKDNLFKDESDKILDKLQSFTILTEDAWEDFKTLFEKLNPGFFRYLLTNYPDITNAELRVGALIKLELSTNNISKTLGISPDSVRKTILRLRKKLSIDSIDELISFILNLNNLKFQEN